MRDIEICLLRYKHKEININCDKKLPIRDLIGKTYDGYITSRIFLMKISEGETRIYCKGCNRSFNGKTGFGHTDKKINKLKCNFFLK